MLDPLPAREARHRPPDRFARGLLQRGALDWLAAGWRDLRQSPATRLIYGLAVMLLSVAVIVGLVQLGLTNLIFPALSGFLVLGPLLAIGLYEKSRRLGLGNEAKLTQMLFVHPRAGGQVAFAGLLLCLLVMLWLRAADLLYALFFDLVAFPGFDNLASQPLTTPRGWAMIVTGSAIGGVFASFAMTTQNLRAVLPWGAIVTLGFALSATTGLLGLIVIFPLLGHGIWHAWVALRPAEDAK